ncbi:MAG: RNA-binding S4 domain-containing protein [Oscillospiraceae bacterium]|nr:RNA-binding S4 domain-containing protein [Oscillospiraceae bacterium]
MRLDKYLKVSRIIKRRTVAKEAGQGGRVTINGKPAKPAAEVRPGDVLEIRFGDRLNRYQVINTQEHAAKADAAAMYTVLAGEDDL